jgi:molybdate transport system substrate-binding protein
MGPTRMLAGALAAVLLLASGATAQEVTLSVAISLKDATEELGRTFTSSHPGVTLRYNFGASGDLQKQIEAGAPVDVFLSAAPRQMDELEKQKLIVTSSRRVFARNVLTVIKPANSNVDIAKPADLLEARVTRIAIGHPKTVPAGQYTEESLRALGLWERLQPKIVFTENVRQALDYVAR